MDRETPVSWKELSIRQQIACLYAVGQRLEAEVTGLPDRGIAACRDVTDMAWCFASGEPAGRPEVNGVVGRMSWFQKSLDPDHSEVVHVIDLFRKIGEATQAAYNLPGATAPQFHTAFRAAEAFQPARGVLDHAILALTRDAAVAGYVDRSTAGEPVDLGPMGPLADLPDEVDRFSRVARPPADAPAIVAVRSRDSDAVIGELIERGARIACVYAPAASEPEIAFVTATIALARERHRDLPPETQFVVYAPYAEPRSFARLASAGAVVLGDDEINPKRRPANIDEFVVAFERFLDEPRRFRPRLEWRFRGDRVAGPGAQAGDAVAPEPFVAGDPVAGFEEVMDLHDTGLGRAGY